MPLPFPDFVEPVAECVIKYDSNTAPAYDAVNVLHFFAAAEAGLLEETQLVALGESLHRWIAGSAPYTDGFNDCFSGEYTVSDIVVTSEQQGAEFQGIVTFGASGNLAGDLLPREVAACASLRTGRPGRNRRGRLFVPGQTEAVNTDGAMESAHADLIVNRITQLVDELSADSGTGEWQLVIASHTTGVITPVTSVLCDTEWDTMRSRGL